MNRIRPRSILHPGKQSGFSMVELLVAILLSSLALMFTVSFSLQGIKENANVMNKAQITSNIAQVLKVINSYGYCKGAFRDASNRPLKLDGRDKSVASLSVDGKSTILAVGESLMGGSIKVKSLRLENFSVDREVVVPPATQAYEWHVGTLIMDFEEKIPDAAPKVRTYQSIVGIFVNKSSKDIVSCGIPPPGAKTVRPATLLDDVLIRFCDPTRADGSCVLDTHVHDLRDIATCPVGSTVRRAPAKVLVTPPGYKSCMIKGYRIDPDNMKSMAANLVRFNLSSEGGAFYLNVQGNKSGACDKPLGDTEFTVVCFP